MTRPILALAAVSALAIAPLPASAGPASAPAPAPPSASAPAATSPVPPGAPVGMALAATDVTCADAALAPGGLLTEGVRCTLGPAGALHLALLDGCSELQLAGAGTLHIEHGQPVVIGARLVARDAAPGCVQVERVALSQDSQVVSGAVLVRGASDGRLSPRGGFVPASHRELRWDGPLADGRPVLVEVEVAGALIVEQELRGPRIELPADLAAGAVVDWTVGPAGFKPGPSLSGHFVVAPEPVGRQLAILKEQAKDAAGWLRVALFCEVHGLEVDAAAAYRAALASDPGSVGARARLTELDLP